MEIITRKNKNLEILENPINSIKKFISKKFEKVINEVVVQVSTESSGKFVQQTKKDYEKEMINMISEINPEQLQDIRLQMAQKLESKVEQEFN